MIRRFALGRGSKGMAREHCEVVWHSMDVDVPVTRRCTVMTLNMFPPSAAPKNKKFVCLLATNLGKSGGVTRLGSVK
jgi:hypothetical protein